ncbi:MAG: hypothetical protein F6J94_10955 [Moorea sp. SIO1F2]|uniref:hypothetical protein n=1 Tax=unclassified Moorena TaxID=2683338 RepID=UPI0013BD0608|nr:MULTISPECIES: hypothetical protein [unclassified Moorena]NEP24581.1 hypothetical protein [Moorena sp. SIO3I6]NET82431.1 hypothetical protein [Moorena sp. SIO1F2]
MAKRPRYANNLQPPNLGQKATLREQPSTLAKRPRYANNLQPPNLQPPNLQPSTQ